LFVSSRRRHTRSKRDWSSDVCSSDLTTQGRKALQTRSFRGSKSRNKVSVGEPAEGSLPSYTTPKPTVNLTSVASAGTPRPPAPEIGRASCRESGSLLVVGVASETDEK